MDLWAAFLSWVLYMELLNRRMCKSVFKILFSIILDISQEWNCQIMGPPNRLLFSGPRVGHKSLNFWHGLKITLKYVVCGSQFEKKNRLEKSYILNQEI